MTICPACAVESEMAPVVSGLACCPACARTLWVEGVARVATSADLEGLSDVEMATLRKSRPAEWRNEQRAMKARLSGRAR